MKAITRLFSRFDSEQTKREIEVELHFHLELLTQEGFQKDMSLADAKATALKRFGNFELIKDQCVEITRRRNPLMRALKLFLILVVIAGVLVRVLSTEYHVTRVGGVLIMVGILSRLLLYVRGLNPSSFLSRPETSSPLRLNENAQTSFPVYDQRRRTPVERVIFDK